MQRVTLLLVVAMFAMLTTMANAYTTEIRWCGAEVWTGGAGDPDSGCPTTQAAAPHTTSDRADEEPWTMVFDIDSDEEPGQPTWYCGFEFEFFSDPTVFEPNPSGSTWLIPDESVNGNAIAFCTVRTGTYLMPSPLPAEYWNKTFCTTNVPHDLAPTEYWIYDEAEFATSKWRVKSGATVEHSSIHFVPDSVLWVDYWHNGLGGKTCAYNNPPTGESEWFPLDIASGFDSRTTEIYRVDAGLYCNADVDDDGICDAEWDELGTPWDPDDLDNCTSIPNAGQRDDDEDGYGNLCDFDVNQDCIIGIPDVSAVFENLNETTPWDPQQMGAFDVDEGGVISVSDVSIVFSHLSNDNGPSARGCADCTADVATGVCP